MGTTAKHVLLHRRSSTRPVRPRGRGIWIASMWRRVEKRGRAGMDERWIWMTLLIYSFDRTDDALSNRKTNPNEDTLTAIGKGGAETRRTNSKEFPARRLGVDHRPTQKFPRPKSHGPRSMTTRFYRFYGLFYGIRGPSRSHRPNPFCAGTREQMSAREGRE